MPTGGGVTHSSRQMRTHVVKVHRPADPHGMVPNTGPELVHGRVYSTASDSPNFASSMLQT